MLTDKQREIFSAILDLNFEGKTKELAAKLNELKEDMGTDAYEKFMSMGKKMFAPKQSL
jgi:hypothetical protein